MYNTGVNLTLDYSSCNPYLDMVHA